MGQLILGDKVQAPILDGSRHAARTIRLDPNEAGMALRDLRWLKGYLGLQRQGRG